MWAKHAWTAKGVRVVGPHGYDAFIAHEDHLPEGLPEAFRDGVRELILKSRPLADNETLSYQGHRGTMALHSSGVLVTWQAVDACFGKQGVDFAQNVLGLYGDAGVFGADLASQINRVAVNDHLAHAAVGM